MSQWVSDDTPYMEVINFIFFHHHVSLSVNFPGYISRIAIEKFEAKFCKIGHQRKIHKPFPERPPEGSNVISETGITRSLAEQFEGATQMVALERWSERETDRLVTFLRFRLVSTLMTKKKDLQIILSLPSGNLT